MRARKSAKAEGESETAESAKIRGALEANGFGVERIQSGLLRVRGGWMHLASKGTPDLLIKWPVYGWIETKTEEGALNDAQKKWHEDARRCGVPVAVARTRLDALNFAIGLRDKR